ncbi:fucose 4-O-acetylase-like acetyltransferase [Arcicella aurantiaca]|uniref:Fucose 4-O-acetylase-like acetyltransferase n=1 Tax=Arcicella aurantiaca TaxID=591202 RepID=A0A316EHD0_9BACT|nr:acyltransferase family protein [Arcicella aurantiaca]PWK22390.1 fucose 4-O-acetylase-like acetyltransferase [Arcicella aurantiaca]
MKRKLDYIEALRGATMLLVFLHHLGVLPTYILVFHMPMFFVISGYLHSLKEQDEDFTIFFKKKFNRLIVPYLGFEFINLLTAFSVQKLFLIMNLEHVYQINFYYAFRNIILCLESPEYIGITNLFWFFPCMFISELLFWFIMRIVSKGIFNGTKIIYLAISVFLVLVSYILHQIIRVRLPFTIDISLMATAFMALGYYSRPIIEYFHHQKLGFQLGISLIGFVGVILAAHYNSEFLMFINEYGNYAISYFGAIFGIIGFSNLIFGITDKGNFQVFEYLSKNSLIFYPIHLNAISFATKVFSYLNLETSSILYTFLPVLKGAVCLILIIPCIYIINHYVPILTGKYKLI